MRLLLLDNYDSFTYNLWDYLLRLGFSVEVWRNDAASLAELDARQAEALVLSPGPGRPADAGLLLPLLRHWTAQAKPLLGVCLGHQALGEVFGAKLQLAAKPMHGKTSELNHTGEDVFQGLPQPCQVMRYHSLLLDAPPPGFRALAHSPEGELMAMRHETLPFWGLQFHPESILSPQGLTLLSNWKNLITQVN